MKIVILFVSLLLILASGWQMYQHLQYDEQTYDVDIYAYIPPQAEEVIHISRKYYVDQLYNYDPEFRFVIEPIEPFISYPIIIAKTNTHTSLLLTKVNREQYSEIEKRFAKAIASKHHYKKSMYNDTKIYSYALDNARFVSYTNHQGILAISLSYALLEQFIDTDTNHIFFNTANYADNAVAHFTTNNPISIFKNIDAKQFAFSLNTWDSKTLLLEGYILNRDVAIDSLIIQFLHEIKLPETLSVDTIFINDSIEEETVKILLNKI